VGLPEKKATALKGKEKKKQGLPTIAQGTGRGREIHKQKQRENRPKVVGGKGFT